MYIWEQPDWPRFHWDQERLAIVLAKARYEQGRLLGRMEALGFLIFHRLCWRTDRLALNNPLRIRN